MKLMRVGPLGQEKPAILDPEGTRRDISALVPDLAGPHLSDAGLAPIREADLRALPALPADARVGACVGHVGKFICVGLNYSDHAKEAGMDLPKEPILFMKATSAICGPDDPILIPPGSEKTDWEVELAVIIGTRAKRVSEVEALDHVAGFAIANDVSERAFQLERSGQWTKGKSYDNFGQLGPWLVTRDEVPDPQDLSLWLTLNGETKQSGTTATMVFGVARLVSHISHFMTLRPGDVISTGTPPGVGMGLKPQQFLRAGDVVELGIEGLGVQRQVATQDA